MTRKQSGFTLIEIIITVAIIGIIASIAYPSYQNQAAKGQRTEGKVALLNASQILERCYTEYGRYNHASCSIQDGGTFNSEADYFSLKAIVSNSTFSIAATRNKGVDNDCHILEIDHTAVKSSKYKSGTPSNDCW